MEIRPLLRPAHGNPIRARLDVLIGSVGLAHFTSELFKVLQGAVACEHLSAFVSGCKGARLVLAESADKDGLAREAGETLATRFWEADPVAEALRTLSGQAFIMRLDGEDLAACTFRRHCYRSAEAWRRCGTRMIGRLSMIQRTERGAVVINLHRTDAQGPFTERDLTVCAGASDVLSSLVARHGRGVYVDPLEAYRAHVHAVMIACPDLPRREAEISAGIVLGLSSEGMGLILAISENTVRTYRKRLYSRLRISSQNELMRIVLPHLAVSADA